MGVSFLGIGLIAVAALVEIRIIVIVCATAFKRDK
jgi:hypothetical protein